MTIRDNVRIEADRKDVPITAVHMAETEPTVILLGYSRYADVDDSYHAMWSCRT